MLTLRPDQRQLMDAASAQFRAGKRRGLIQAPTGFGKTVLTSQMFRSAATRVRSFCGCRVSPPAGRGIQRGAPPSPPRHYAPRSTLDLSGVRTRLGDYHRGDLSAAVDRSSVDHEGVDAYFRLAPGKRTL